METWSPVTLAQLKALSEPTRLHIIDLLCRSPGPRFGPVQANEPGLCLANLQVRTGVSHALLGHHLRVLRRSGLVKAEHRGRWTIYRARTDALSDLSRALLPPPGGSRPEARVEAI